MELRYLKVAAAVWLGVALCALPSAQGAQATPSICRREDLETTDRDLAVRVNLTAEFSNTLSTIRRDLTYTWGNEDLISQSVLQGVCAAGWISECTPVTLSLSDMPTFRAELLTSLHGACQLHRLLLWDADFLLSVEHLLLVHVHGLRLGRLRNLTASLQEDNVLFANDATSTSSASWQMSQTILVSIIVALVLILLASNWKLLYGIFTSNFGPGVIQVQKMNAESDCADSQVSSSSARSQSLIPLSDFQSLGEPMVDLPCGPHGSHIVTASIEAENRSIGGNSFHSTHGQPIRSTAPNVMHGRQFLVSRRPSSTESFSIDHHTYTLSTVSECSTNPSLSKKLSKQKSFPNMKVDFMQLKMQKLIGTSRCKEVYRGTWEGNNVAILKLREGVILAEAEIMHRLGCHPNLVQFYRWSRDAAGTEYIVMELLPSGSLTDHLRTKRFPMTDKLMICQQICSAMINLNEEGIVHADLAARNVLVASTNPLVVKVSDFGLSRTWADLDDKSNINKMLNCIPLRWAAPEIFSDWKWSEKTDVWAFGVVLWEIFSDGEEPYTRELGQDAEPEEILNFVMRKNVLSKPANCPVRIFEIIQACWSFRPDHRPPFQGLQASLKRLAKLCSENPSALDQPFSSGRIETNHTAGPTPMLVPHGGVMPALLPNGVHGSLQPSRMAVPGPHGLLPREAQRQAPEQSPHCTVDVEGTRVGQTPSLGVEDKISLDSSHYLSTCDMAQGADMTTTTTQPAGEFDVKVDTSVLSSVDVGHEGMQGQFFDGSAGYSSIARLAGSTDMDQGGYTSIGTISRTSMDT